MSQHSQGTQQGPSVGSIVRSGTVTMISAAGTTVVFSGPGFTVREMVGCLLGASLTGALMGHTFGLGARRAVARDRAERMAEYDRQTAEYEAREAEGEELRRWQAATAGLLDAHLTGSQLDFAGESVPEYVRLRLADTSPDLVAEAVIGMDEQCAPVDYSPRYEDHTPPAPPLYPRQDLDLTEPIPKYREQTLGYQADPERPWRAFESTGSHSVSVPLPPRSPDNWNGADTEVIRRTGPDDQTEVINRQS